MSNIPKKSTLLEKVFYCGGGLGGGALCWGFFSSFITMYYTNSVGMAAATMGTMMLVARILDAVSDIIFGAIMERFPSRLGKARHWILLSVIFLPLSLFLCFNFPAGLSEGGKMAYMYITYICISAVTYTVYGSAFGALMARMSEDQKDIEHISVAYMTSIMAASTVVYMLTMNLMEHWGGMVNNQPAWTKISAIYAIITVVLLFLSFLIKEKVPLKVESGEVQKTPIAQGIKVCMKYRYFWLLLVIFFAYYVASGLAGSAGTYYILYVIGDYKIVNYTSLPNLACQVGMMLLTPLILKKVSKMKLMWFGILLSFLSRIPIILAPTNIPIYVVCGILATIGLAPLISLLFTLSVDFIVYIAYKTGLRAEGFAGIGGNIGVKVGTGIGTALVGWLLQWGKFDGMAQVQPDSAKTAIILLVVVLPAVCYAILLVALRFWNLDKKLPEAMAEAEAAAAAAQDQE